MDKFIGGKYVSCLLISLFSCLVNEGLIAQNCKEEKINWPGGPVECDTSQYQLVFSDEFNAGQLDTSKWYTYYPYGAGKTDQCEFCRTHGDSEAQVYLPENLVYTDSTLRLVARKQDTSWYNAQRNYTSGMIHSKLHFKYGKYEIRCKIPQGRGFWPAFWMWGKDECDVFEFCSHKPKVLKSNVHMDCDGRHFMDSKRHKGKNYAKAFHTFAVEWEPQHVIWRVDGQVIRKIYRLTTTKGKPLECGEIVPEGTLVGNKLIPDEYMQVIANLALCKKGGYCKRKGINKRTPFPSFFEIDYIRVYQKNKAIKMLD